MKRINNFLWTEVRKSSVPVGWYYSQRIVAGFKTAVEQFGCDFIN